MTMREGLLRLLDLYATRWPDQAGVAARFTRFIRAHDDCLLRSCVPGHLTGAALVTTPSMDRVLLTHHRKLGKWLQLGGHADGEADMSRVAASEAEEESGLADLRWLEHPRLLDVEGRPLPFDLDIHEIPAHKGDPSHLHYDVRYVIVASDAAPVVVSDESHDVRWFALDEARAVTSEESMLRQFDKLAALRESMCGRPC